PFVGYPSVKLLGYIVDGEGIQRTDNRIKAFRKIKFLNSLNILEIYFNIVGWFQ
ncbi:hypothetical protein QBC45DRAFT_331820, partial [Copromyces sp. CBS 386.78]